MCLIVDKNLNPEVITEPKTVYKLITYEDGRPLSFFIKHPYQFGVEAYAQIEENNQFTFCGERDRKLAEKAFGDELYSTKSIGPGIHYYADVEALKEDWPGMSYNSDKGIMECLIPSGAEIIESWGLGVTNRLIPIKGVSINEI